jgi:DNA modification methylase
VSPESFIDGRVLLVPGDCLSVLKTLEAGSVDSVVTDPPYGLEFMGKDWDGSDGFRRSLNEADAGRDSVFGRTSRRAPEYRTSGAGQKSKPGIGERSTDWVNNQGWNQFRCASCGHLFHGGTPCKCDNPQPVRADNRWNIFQTWCEAWARECLRVLKPGGHLVAFGGSRTYHRLACAVEDAGFEIRDQIQWIYGSGFPKSRNIGDGLGTALKPAHEPIVLARKPLVGTVAANVGKFQVGALNIDQCRVEATDSQLAEKYASVRNAPPRNNAIYGTDKQPRSEGRLEPHGNGRWPANVAHDGSDEVIGCFPRAGGGDKRGVCQGRRPGGFGDVGADRGDGEPNAAVYSDSGSAARFFYCAKASKIDRAGSKHPTVKPIALLRWLVRLITPRDGVVLDLFAGTGTTGHAAYLEGMRAVLIERESEYQDDIRKRMASLSEVRADTDGCLSKVA